MTKRTLRPADRSSVSSLFATGLVLELIVRLGTRCDEDGNCIFHATRLRPFHPAVRRAENIIAQYQASTTSDLLYDSELGWRLRPLVNDHNAAGFISSSPEVPVEHPGWCASLRRLLHRREL